MKKITDKVDYSGFSLSKINNKEYRHLYYLLYWPLYMLVFFIMESLIDPASCHLIHLSIDDKIPFCEYFIIPYVLWYIYLVAPSVLALFLDVDTFKKSMKFLIFTNIVAILIMIIYPNYQDLRPTVFEHDNIFTKAVAYLYSIDTNTNVCPSGHVIGSIASLFTVFRLKIFEHAGWKIFFVLLTLSICASTMLLKQHSFFDFLCALPICAIGYVLFYWRT